MAKPLDGNGATEIQISGNRMFSRPDDLLSRPNHDATTGKDLFFLRFVLIFVGFAAYALDDVTVTIVKSFGVYFVPAKKLK